MPIQVFVQRIFSFSPSEKKETDRETLAEYQWNLQEFGGGEVNFTDAEGKVVILNFWATWCPPCVAEMPSFQQLYNQYGDRVIFYFVTTEKPAKIADFMEKNEYSLPVYFENSPAPLQLHSKVLPTTFVISKTGRIIIEEEGTADWNSPKMHRLLNTLLTE